MSDVYWGPGNPPTKPPAATEVPSHPPDPWRPIDSGEPTSPPPQGRPGSDPNRSSDQRPSGGSNPPKVLLAVSAVVIVVLAVAIGYVFGTSNSESADPTTTPPSVAAVADQDSTEPARSTEPTEAGTPTPEEPAAARLPVPDSVPVDPASLNETQQRAAAAAAWYLDWAPGASRAETIEWLTDENADEVFTVDDAVAGIDSLGEDWVENARLTAEAYLADQGYSRLGLLTQMTGSHTNQFTVHQATTAVDSMNIDWDAEAVRYVEHSTEYGTYSRGSLLYMMTETDRDDFTLEQANTALDSAGVDWNAEAVEEAESIRNSLPDLTCAEALEFMEGDTKMFEPDQARHGLEAVEIC